LGFTVQLYRSSKTPYLNNKMKEAGKFPCIREKRNTSRVSENLKERANLEDLDVDGTVKLK